jgi:hypothetical protein
MQIHYKITFGADGVTVTETIQPEDLEATYAAPKSQSRGLTHRSESPARLQVELPEQALAALNAAVGSDGDKVGPVVGGDSYLNRFVGSDGDKVGPVVGGGNVQRPFVVVSSPIVIVQTGPADKRSGREE